MNASLKLCVVAPLLALAVGCGGSAPTAMGPQQAQVIATPRVLTESLYAKDGSGALTEADLQKILESPIDLQLPARLGVVPLATPFDPKGPVSLTTRTIAARDLAAGL